MEICKVCKFYEGGIQYSELANMPIDEFLGIVECANEIDKQQQKLIKAGKNG